MISQKLQGIFTEDGWQLYQFLQLQLPNAFSGRITVLPLVERVQKEWKNKDEMLKEIKEGNYVTDASIVTYISDMLYLLHNMEVLHNTINNLLYKMATIRKEALKSKDIAHIYGETYKELLYVQSFVNILQNWQLNESGRHHVTPHKDRWQFLDNLNELFTKSNVATRGFNYIWPAILHKNVHSSAFYGRFVDLVIQHLFTVFNELQQVDINVGNVFAAQKDELFMAVGTAKLEHVNCEPLRSILNSQQYDFSYERMYELFTGRNTNEATQQ